MQASDWIKCSDALPPVRKHKIYRPLNELVLIYWLNDYDEKAPNISKAYLTLNDHEHEYEEETMWESYDGVTDWAMSEVTHWMPIVGPEAE